MVQEKAFSHGGHTGAPARTHDNKTGRFFKANGEKDTSDIKILQLNRVAPLRLNKFYGQETPN
jgi:hypothetical protein